MRYPFILALLFLVFVQCETNRFDSDKRQIAAKDAVRQHLRQPRGFDVSSFREDTVSSLPDSMLNRLLRYTLYVHFADSTGTDQQRRAEVLFTPDGTSPIGTNITNP